MTAIQRSKRNYYRRKGRKKKGQRRSQKFLSRRRKLYAKRRKSRMKHIIRVARNKYSKRRLHTSRYLKKRTGDNMFSSPKGRSPLSSYKKKGYHRKPARVGRPKKKKYATRGRPSFLKRKLKAKVCRKRMKDSGSSAEKRARRKPRHSDDEIFYSMANSSSPKAITEDRQSKKHSVRFNNPSNMKNQVAESLSQEEMSCDNQQNQQAVIPKKRGRHSTTTICKTR